MNNNNLNEKTNILSINDDFIRGLDSNQENSTINNIKLYENFIFNNLNLKNKYCFIGFNDDEFIDKNCHIKDDFFNFYRLILKSNVGLIVSGGFSLGQIYNNQNSKLNFSNLDFRKLTEFNDEIHTAGTKSFFKIKPEYGRADLENKFYNLVSYSSSFNKDYNNSKLYCMRISDGICSDIIEKMNITVDFAVKTKYDGILIEGDLYSIIGELSSNELNRRIFGYYSNISDFTIKLLKKIKEKHKDINIIYSFSVKSYIDKIYGNNYKKIQTLKNFKQKIDNNKIIEFMLKLIENGVDGFVFNLGTYETEFLSQTNEFFDDDYLEKLYININNIFSEKKVKNKFGNDVIFIYNEVKKFHEEILMKNNFLLNVTKNILADYNFLYKINNNLKYRNCIRCGYCSDKFCNKNATSCIINPRYSSINKSLKNEKIAIVGAGLSGINCALYLAKQGYNVDLYEKNSEINLSCRLKEIFGFNYLLKNYNDFLENKINEYISYKNINLIKNKKFDLNLLSNEKYTTVIVSTGSSEKFSNIPGAVLRNVKSINDVLSNKKLIENAKNIVINGKTEISLSLAEYLLLNKKRVTLIINSIDDLFNIKNSRLTYYLYSLNKLKCKVFLNTKVKRIERDFVELIINSKIENKPFVEVVLNTKSGQKYKYEKKAKNIDVDLFIDEPTIVPNNRIYYDIVTSNYLGKVFMIGNALKVSTIDESIKSALFVAKNI